MVRRGVSCFSAARGRRLLAGSCLAALAVLSQPAMAQSSATPEQGAAQARDTGIEDIVVTARFVSENIQDTPIAITAQTSAQLKAANVSNVSMLGAVVPNLQTVPGDSQSAGTPLIRLRGVVQGVSSSLAVPPAVAIYTDDIYHATTAGSELDFTDIERVEVNRGPQSTLSGNASIGGSIKLYTKDPQGDGSGYISFTGGSRKKLGVTGAIDLGLSPTLSMRASGHFERQDGFGDRLDFACMMDKLGTPALKGSLGYFQPDSGSKGCVIGHTGGGTTTVGQVKLRWQPTDAIDLILTARHREENLEETPEITLSFQPACITGGAGPQPCSNSAGAQAYHRAVLNTFGFLPDNRFVPPARGGGIYDTYATNCRPILDTAGISGFPAGYPFGICYDQGKTAHHTLFSGKLHVDLSDKVRMTAIGGYTNYANEFTQNGDQSPLGYVISHFINHDEQWSGEIRFDGSLFNDKLDWVVGAFKLRMEGHQNNMLTFVNIFQLAEVTGINDSQSAFFHLDYNITDRWRVSGGARYSDSSIAITTRNPQTLTGGLTDLGASKQKRWDWLISTDFKVTDDILLYASAASGSRPPGVVTIVSTPRQYGPTAAEDLINYEAGIKADLFDRRLRTNLSAFYMDYRKIASVLEGIECRNQPGTTATWFPERQATAAAITRCGQFPGLSDPVLFNLAAQVPATVKGIEWEITAMPIHGLRIDWTGGYNKFVSGVKTPGEVGYIFPGNHRQPEWNMHANVSYDVETSIGTFTPRLDWNWQSQQDYDAAGIATKPPEAIFIIKPYSLWNAQLAYEAPDRGWSATLTVSNLADKWYHYQVFRGSVNAQTRVGAPREFALTVRKSF